MVRGSGKPKHSGKTGNRINSLITANDNRVTNPVHTNVATNLFPADVSSHVANQLLIAVLYHLALQTAFKIRYPFFGSDMDETKIKGNDVGYLSGKKKYQLGG